MPCTGRAGHGPRHSYPVTGIVLKVDPAHRSFTASCAAMPGYMEAMSMPYSVRDPKLLAADCEGNDFTAKQLADYIAAVLEQH